MVGGFGHDADAGGAGMVVVPCAILRQHQLFFAVAELVDMSAALTLPTLSDLLTPLAMTFATLCLPCRALQFLVSFGYTGMVFLFLGGSWRVASKTSAALGLTPLRKRVAHV